MPIPILASPSTPAYSRAILAPGCVPEGRDGLGRARHHWTPRPGPAYLRDISLNEARHNGERTARIPHAARGLDAGRITVIPNWADGALIRPCPSSGEQAAQGLGLSGEVRDSGNMEHAHEFGTILKVVDRAPG